MQRKREKKIKVRVARKNKSKLNRKMKPHSYKATKKILPSKWSKLNWNKKKKNQSSSSNKWELLAYLSNKNRLLLLLRNKKKLLS